MITFEVDGRRFKCEKMNVFDQAHLLAAVSPLVAGLAPLFMQISSEGGLSADVSTLPDLLMPLAKAVFSMKTEEREQLISRCISPVQVEHEGRWIQLWNPVAKQSNLSELNDLFPMLKIVIQVVQANLGNFLRGLLTVGAQPGKTTTA